MRELFAIAAAIFSMKILAIAMAGPAQALLYTRFWLDDEMVVRVAWLLSTSVAIAVIEGIRRTPHPWPVLKPSFRAQLFYLAGVPMVSFGVAALAAVVLDHAAHDLQWASFGETAIAEIAGLFIAAAQEELLFRYILLGSLSRLLHSKLVALAAVTVFFTAAHPGQNMAFVFAAGLWFGAIYLTESVWPAAIAHFMLNLSVQLLFSHTSIISKPIYDTGVYALFQQILGVLLAISSLWMLRHHVRPDGLYAAGQRLANWLRQRLV
jgi:membrane protease YdiL (CAAX protease family)